MNLELELDNLINDNLSGSTTILNQLIDILLEYFQKPGIPSKKHIKKIGKQILRNFPNFSTVYHFLSELLIYIESYESINNIYLVNFLVAYQEKWGNISSVVAKNFVDKVDVADKTILLHSNSSSIHDIFKEIKTKDLNARIIQTASYPAKEGIVQAKTLSEYGFEVKLIADSSVSRYISKIDFTILGADAIFNDHFINKVGSFGIAISSQFYNKPVYVIADSRKIIDSNQYAGLEIENLSKEKTKNPLEICDEDIFPIHIENYYFEDIPNKLATLFIYENN